MRSFNAAVGRVSAVFLTALVVSLAASAQESKKPRPKPITAEDELRIRAEHPLPPPKPSFYISPITQLPGSFSLLLSDANNRTVAGSFRAAQLDIFEAVLAAAIEFGRTEEDVGKTTRFADKDERSLIVDVQKTPKTTTFFVTLSYLNAKVTVEAGSITRKASGEQETLVLEILNRIRSAPQSN